MKMEYALEIVGPAVGYYEDKLKHIRVRKHLVEASNGAVLIRIPISDAPDWLPENGLVSKESAAVIGAVGELPSGKFLVSDGLPFPNTDKLVQETKAKTPAFSISVDPEYLALVATALVKAGSSRVLLTFYGELDIITIEDTGSKATAYLMPMR